LAASQESPLHIDAKKAIVAASSTQLSVFPELNQNALKFSDLTQPDDSNHTLSLKTGAYYNPGKSGHLFIGAGVDFVKDIRPVKEIIEYLVSEL
jgi:hypothetical protein